MKLDRAEKARRRAWSKAVEGSALRDAARGSGWRKLQNSLCCVRDGWFVEATVSVYQEPWSVRWELSAKPVAIDAVFWEIVGVDFGPRASVTRHASASLCCAPLPALSTSRAPGEATPEEVSAEFLRWAESAGKRLVGDWGDRCFSELVAAHVNQRERGVYAESLLCALITEGQVARAAALNADVLTGAQVGWSSHWVEGRSFLEHVRDWLDAEGGC